MVRWPYHSTVFAKPIALSVLTTLATFCAIPYRAAAGHKAKGDVEQDRTFANICTEITTKDATHHTITSKGVNAALGNVPAVSRSIRLVPETKDGSVFGYRTSAIRPRSLPACLGFKNGDLIQAINDIPVTVPDMVMQNYAKILATGIVRFSILRKQSPVVLEIKMD